MEEYITDEVRAKIGVKAGKRTSTEAIGADSLRRFVQATMEPNPIHWDEDAGAGSRFGGVVAPPLFPMHAFRREHGTPDPLDKAADDHDFDGSSSGASTLPSLGLALKRRLNAGSEVEFFRLAKVGDVISEDSCYSAIEQKVSRSGEPIVLATVETEFTNDQGETLLKVYKTSMIR